MEILKHPLYQQIAVQHQVMIIYAAINNYLADLEIDQIKSFEKQLVEFMDTQYPQVGKSIKSTGKLDEESEKPLQEGIGLCKKSFLRLSV